MVHLSQGGLGRVPQMRGGLLAVIARATHEKRSFSPGRIESSRFFERQRRAATVSGWGERSNAQIAETGTSHCSLVVLNDTEAHYLGPLLTVQPSFTMSY